MWKSSCKAIKSTVHPPSPFLNPKHTEIHRWHLLHNLPETSLCPAAETISIFIILYAIYYIILLWSDNLTPSTANYLNQSWQQTAGNVLRSEKHIVH